MEVLQNIQTQSVYHHPECFAKNFRPRIGIKSSKIWRRIFEPSSKRSLGSILKYVLKGATKKKAKKASYMGEFILIFGGPKKRFVLHCVFRFVIRAVKIKK
jgi:hypothetical protein